MKPVSRINLSCLDSFNGMVAGFIVWDENQTTIIQVDGWKRTLSSLETNWMISLFGMGKTSTTTVIGEGKRGGRWLHEVRANGCDVTHGIQ